MRHIVVIGAGETGIAELDTPVELTPSRLEFARKRRGLNKTELAQKLEVTPRVVSAWESDGCQPTPNNLARIASVLQFPISFFSQPEIEVPDHTSMTAASFRSMASMTASQRDAALSAGVLAYGLCDWIEERFDLPSVDLPDLRHMKPDVAAQALRELWGLGVQPIRSMVHVMEAHGVRVFSLTENCDEVDAFSVWHGGKPFCFLNTMKTAERSRHDCAHELGHLVLHRHGVPQDRVTEREADAFAAAFLMPLETVRAHVPAMATLSTLINLKSIWAVSVASLAYRAHKAGKLTDRHYRGICIDLNRRGKANEPSPIPNRETSQVLQKVFAALREDGLSKADVAAALHLYQHDVDEIVFGLVLTAVDGAAQKPPPTASRPLSPPGPPQLRLVRSM